jgi:hypothetical protein
LAEIITCWILYADLFSTKGWIYSPAHVEVYSIQLYVIKYVSDLLQVGVPINNIADFHDIIDALLNVTFDTLTI